jgi:phospholipid/cholesterol/gamma-HCH transport system ATP-binding protein
MEPIITVSEISTYYGQRRVLENLSMEVLPGEIMVILGTSGCGKTTLLKNMIGLLEYQTGRIELLGSELSTLDDSRKSELLTRVGVLFQNGALLNSLTILENLSIPIEQHTKLHPSIIKDVVLQKLELVGLAGSADLYPNQLSGGMRKRAALARAIALDPEILFADEPGAGLDPVTARQLDLLLLTLQKYLNMTIVVVSHELASIQRIAGRISFLSESRLLFSGPLNEALRQGEPAMDEFFSSHKEK